MNDPVSAAIPPDDPSRGDLPPADTRAQSAAARQAIEERRRQREHNDLLTVLATPEGRAVVMRILSYANPYASTIRVINGHDEVSPVAEGRRDVGLFIVDVITKADPARYARLTLEHLEHKRRMEAEDAAIAEEARRKLAPRSRLERIAERIGLRLKHADDA